MKRGGGWVSQVGSSINPSQPPSLLSHTDITAREGEGGLNQSFLNERNSAMKYNTDVLVAIEVEQSFYSPYMFQTSTTQSPISIHICEKSYFHIFQIRLVRRLLGV